MNSFSSSSGLRRKLLPKPFLKQQKRNCGEDVNIGFISQREEFRRNEGKNDHTQGFSSSDGWSRGDRCPGDWGLGGSPRRTNGEGHPHPECGGIRTPRPNTGGAP